MSFVKPTHSIKSRLLIMFILGGAVPMLLAMWLMSQSYQRSHLESEQTRILQIATAREHLLEDHFSTLTHLGEYLAILPCFESFLDAHLSGDQIDDDLYLDAGRELSAFQTKNWGQLHHVMLTDRDGRVILNAPKQGWGVGMSAEVMRHAPGPHHDQVIPLEQHETSETIVTGFFGFEEQDHYHQLIIAPVTSDVNGHVGYVVMEVSIDALQGFILNEFSIGETGNLYLITPELLRVVHQKEAFDPNSVVHEGIRQAKASGKPVVGWYELEGGKRVLGAYITSSVYPWIVCVEVDHAEVIGTLKALNRVMIVVTALTIAGFVLATFLVGRSLWRPLGEISQAADRISSGDVWHEIEVGRKDEIAQIQQAVEDMRLSLKQQIDHLDALIAERTSELEYVNEQLERDSREDKLTGLANRQVMVEMVTRELNQYQRGDGYRFAVLFFDFDRFKIVNDSLGHAVGDALLCSIADRFREHLRSYNLAARFGGDEFVVCLANLKNDEEALLAANRLLSVFAEPHDIDGHRIVSTASIGLVTAAERYESADELIRDADAAMYEAKSAGKGQVMIFDQKMHENAQNRMRIEEDMSHAVERGQLRVMYQPIIRIDDMKLDGFEALIRWEHPTLGLVRPDYFIPIAEDTGQIVEIGNWILDESLRQLRAWDEIHGEDRALSMNVNVAKRQLIHPEFIEHVREALERNAIDPQRVKLEITESTAIDPRHDMSQTIRDVKDLGVKIAMDDFGTGHSSLSLLHQFDLDVIKIDKSFIQGMERSREMGAVLHSIIALAQNMGKSVVAEGVETPSQIAALLSHSCDLVQGYYFSKPMFADEAGQYIPASDRLSEAA